MKTQINHYKLSFVDRDDNELTTKVVAEFNIKGAREYAQKLKDESQINDLFKIKVSKMR